MMAYVLDDDMYFRHEELNEFEARDLASLAIEIARHGRVNYDHPAWNEWKHQSNANMHVPLLEWTTVFYQRITLVVLEYALTYGYLP